MIERADVMDLLNADGWDGLGEQMAEKLKAGIKASQAIEDGERRRQAKLYLDTFSTDAGKQVLELLRKATIDRAPTQADMDERDPHVVAMMAQRRMGAANLVHMILAAMDFARGLKAEEIPNVS